MMLRRQHPPIALSSTNGLVMLIFLFHLKCAVTRIRTWVIAATTQCTNHYTITAEHGGGVQVW